MHITVADEPTAGWNDLVASRPDAPVYLMREWTQLIARVFRHQAIFVSSRNGRGELTGVLPLVRLRTALFGDYLASLPLFNSGGAVAVDDRTAVALMTQAVEVARSLGVRHVEFRDREPREGLWKVRTDKVAMRLQLPRDKEEMWRGFGSKLRSQVRRADREQLTVTIGKRECVDDFYDVFAAAMRDVGTPVYPKRFFTALCEALPQACDVVVLSRHSRPVAAGWLVKHGSVAEVPWAACLREAKSGGVNMRLYWEMIQHAIACRCEVFDFGRSSKDSGTFRFKQQWGAQPRQLYWHYWVREGEPMPDITPANARYRLAIGAWRRMPLWLTKIIGPSIARGLP